jgi:hypothetical protein
VRVPNLQVSSSHAREQRGHGAPCGVPVVQPAREHHLRQGEAVHACGPQPGLVANQGHDALATAASRTCRRSRGHCSEAAQQRRDHRLRPRAAGHARASGLGHGCASARHDGRRIACASHGDGLHLQRQRRQRRQADGPQRHRRVPAMDGRAEAIQQAPPAAYPEAPVLDYDIAHRGAGLNASRARLAVELNGRVGTIGSGHRS